MQKLLDGVQRFQKHIFGQHREHFEKLKSSQAPETLFITCSDSRIHPSLLTQAEPGDIFIIRNAGNIIPRWPNDGGEAASVEYALEVLEVKDIVVCGHSNCGAMNALLNPPPEDRLPIVSRWLEHAARTRALIREKYADRTPEQQINVATQENVLAQLHNLKTHPSVTARLARGALRLHAWVYKIETGEVFFFDPEIGQFRPIA